MNDSPNRFDPEEFDKNDPKDTPIIGGLTSDNVAGHLLQQMGVLKSFSISKVITEEELNNLYQKASEKSTNEKDFEKNVKKSLSKISKPNVKKEPIPGIIYKSNSIEMEKIIKEKIEETFSKNKMQDKDNKDGRISDERLDQLSRISIILADLISKEKLSQKEASFIIVSLVKILGLDKAGFDESDFYDFEGDNGEEDDGYGYEDDDDDFPEPGDEEEGEDPI